MSQTVYLDHAATTPIAGEVLAVMLATLRDRWGNPSSHHSAGRAARAAVDDARDRLAAVIAAHAREIVFVSGGSEADNLAVRGVLDRWSSRGRHVVVSAIEHDAMLKTVEGLAALGRAEVTVVPCNDRGIVDAGEFAAAVREDTVLASLMLANNEVGTLQDVAGAAAQVRHRNPRTIIHTDAVQALGRCPVDVDALGIDLLTISAHKVYGPKGVGALYVRSGVLLETQVTGGGQERNRRCGTENVTGIAAFAAAAEMADRERDTEVSRQGALARRLTERIVSGVPDIVVTGDGAPRLSNFATFAVPGVPTEVALAALDHAGVCVSGGSACSSGASLPSHVLVAMGLPATLASGALRCTLGRSTTPAEIDLAADAIIRVINHARRADVPTAPGPPLRAFSRRHAG